MCMLWRSDCDPVDALTSWIIFLHIPEKAKLFHRCRETMKKGGQMYATQIGQCSLPQSKKKVAS